MAHRWATEHFGKSRILKKSCLNFFLAGDHLFSAGKTVSIYFKTDLAGNLGEVLEQYFESGAMKVFKIKMGHG